MRKRYGSRESKATRVVPVRFTLAELEEIDFTIQRRNLHFPRYAKWDLSKFIRRATSQLIRKMERSRAPRVKKSVKS